MHATNHKNILFVCAIQWLYTIPARNYTIHNGIRKYSNLLHFINVQFRKKNQFSFSNRKSQQQNDSEVFVYFFSPFFLYIFFNEREFINQCCMVQGHNYFLCARQDIVINL